jgi:hypothetical protein
MLSGKGKKEISIEKATGHYYFYWIRKDTVRHQVKRKILLVQLQERYECHS